MPLRILKIDTKNGFFEVIPDSLDDMWHLERIIEEGDVVSAKTERKIKPKEEGMEVTKETVYYDILAQRIEFHESTGHLRVLGVIVGGHPQELVDLKAHHSIEVFGGKQVKVKKDVLKNYQIERLRQAEKASGRGKTFLVVMDDEGAEFALLKEFGIEQKGRISSGKSGKRFSSEDKELVFFEKILTKVFEEKPEQTVFAGPGFTKNNFKKFLEDKKIKLKSFFEHTDSVGTTGLNELIKTGVIEKIAAQTRLVAETKLVEKVLEELGKNNGMAAISLKHAIKAIEANAAEHVILSDRFLLENRAVAEKILADAEEKGGQVHIVSYRSDAGKKMHGLGGIACLLRYSMWEEEK